MFSAFWKRVDEATNLGLLIATSEVIQDLKKGGDEVYKWVQERSQMFVAPVEAVQERGIDILAVHTAS